MLSKSNTKLRKEIHEIGYTFFHRPKSGLADGKIFLSSHLGLPRYTTSELRARPPAERPTPPSYKDVQIALRLGMREQGVTQINNRWYNDHG
jgi:hypothetical protein